ncbi:MAG: hypothetical protein GC180_01175 [Bacteroidetes bacterium]|nr:hypothetical protein [Bacteroidota bacterium]
MKKVSLFLGLTAFILVFFSASSCRKEKFDTDPSATLNFSTDTVLFDTVFTKLGGGPNPRSVNKQFTVRNPHNKSIKTSIHLGMGNASPFRINVDGLAVSEIKDYEIRANDSMYIFVEVSVDPNNQSNPLIIQDSVVFETNGNIQDVKLVAWGQDAYYLKDSVLNGNIVWSDKTKPYVIYNSILINSGATLTIEQGVHVYNSVASHIYVNGSLQVNGSKDFPVIFEGARLGQEYTNTASQWYGIRLLPGSKNNVIHFAEIKNGIVGLEVDSLQTGGGYKLNISNTKILNMSAGGLIGYTAWINAVNVLSANCGQYTFLGELGGKYNLTHCTFANYSNVFLHSKPSFGLSNANYDDGNGTVLANDLEATINSTIIWGSLKEEMVFFNGGNGKFEPTFFHSLLKTEIQANWTPDIKLNEDPKFIDYRELNFQLDTLSPAKDAGDAGLIPPVTDDLNGDPRDSKPDIGAFERKD